MVVIEIAGDDAPEVAFVQNNDVIEAVASQGSDEPLHERVLPRTSRCAKDLLDPHALDPSLKCAAVDRIAVPKQVSRRAVPWKGFDDLLPGPQRGRMLGDVEMNHLSSGMCEYDQHEQQLEPDRRHNEEIDRHQIREVILQKRLPCRRGWLARSDTVLVHR